MLIDQASDMEYELSDMELLATPLGDDDGAITDFYVDGVGILSTEVQEAPIHCDICTAKIVNKIPVTCKLCGRKICRLCRSADDREICYICAGEEVFRGALELSAEPDDWLLGLQLNCAVKLLLGVMRKGADIADGQSRDQWYIVSAMVIPEVETLLHRCRGKTFGPWKSLMKCPQLWHGRWSPSEELPVQQLNTDLHTMIVHYGQGFILWMRSPGAAWNQKFQNT